MDFREIIDLVIDAAIERSESSHMVLDFSNSFKSKGKRKGKKQSKAPTELKEVRTEIPETYEIPVDLETTIEDMQLRKVLDIRRWFCMSRPQYSRSAGITCLISCWNFLFSTLGAGVYEPLSQEKALLLLGFEPPFKQICFGPITSNDTLIDWFNRLTFMFGYKAQARILWKLHGKGKTVGIDSQDALHLLCEGLKNPKQAFVYHCYNHYMCPIGYEITPYGPAEAYKPTIDEGEPWVIIGEPCQGSPVFQVKKWEHIAVDINMQNPEFFNIRQPQLGIQTKEGEAFVSGKNLGKNMHCIIMFESLE